MKRSAIFGAAIAFVATPLSAEVLTVSPQSSDGGSSTITANSTATSGFSAGNLLYSDGTKVQAFGATVSGNNWTLPGSLALNGLSIGSNSFISGNSSSIGWAITSSGNLIPLSLACCTIGSNTNPVATVNVWSFVDIFGGVGTTFGWNNAATLALDANTAVGLKNGANSMEFRVYNTTTGPIYTSIKADGSLMNITGQSFTSGSTANVPTLTAGPVTGNPTKWVPINDNGTTRYIPTW